MENAVNLGGRAAARCSAGFAEKLVPLRQKVPVGSMVFASGHEQAGSIEALQTVDKHWPVLLAENVAADLNNQVRPDSQHQPIERRMMQCAKSQSIGDHRRTLGVAIWKDVRGI